MNTSNNFFISEMGFYFEGFENMEEITSIIKQYSIDKVEFTEKTSSTLSYKDIANITDMNLKYTDKNGAKIIFKKEFIDENKSEFFKNIYEIFTKKGYRFFCNNIVFVYEDRNEITPYENILDYVRKEKFYKAVKDLRKEKTILINSYYYDVEKVAEYAKTNSPIYKYILSKIKNDNISASVKTNNISFGNKSSLRSFHITKKEDKYYLEMIMKKDHAENAFDLYIQKKDIFEFCKNNMKDMINFIKPIKESESKKETAEFWENFLNQM